MKTSKVSLIVLLIALLFITASPVLADGNCTTTLDDPFGFGNSIADQINNIISSNQSPLLEFVIWALSDQCSVDINFGYN